ncbi:helix-turn-helix transcriptional regulator [Nocardiopsis sp. NPDC007018]|uniref:helix-turn-helix domain-containing protein n=1 Tax=Nocardiopsis sp. NPDC007018 TaxID=3155721 RepID=UPI0033E64030
MATDRRSAKHPLDHQPEAVTWARKQAGLTKTQLAKEVGVSLSLISEIEAGTRNATPANLKLIAAALGCPRVVLERKPDRIGGAA